MSHLPKALTPRFGDDALPDYFQAELRKHFELVPYDVYEHCPSKYDKGFNSIIRMKRINNTILELVAIFPWVVGPPVTAEMLDRMPALKIVSTISAGYNHLDIAMIRSKNVRVGNTPGVLDDATAEQGITLMLAAARNTVLGMN